MISDSESDNQSITSGFSQLQFWPFNCFLILLVYSINVNANIPITGSRGLTNNNEHS